MTPDLYLCFDDIGRLWCRLPAGPWFLAQTGG